jgi:hypothetical protein
MKMRLLHLLFVAVAVRKQSPVVANEFLTSIAGKFVPGAYDGYASCPLTTAGERRSEKIMRKKNLYT